MEHCVASYQKYKEELLYQVYVTDVLKTIAENTAKATNNGAFPSRRYADIILEEEANKSGKKDDKSTAQGIKASIRAKWRGER